MLQASGGVSEPGADSALGELQLCTVWGASQTHSRAPAVTGRQTLKQANSEVS